MYQKHSQTSQQASESIEPSANTLRARVFYAIDRQGVSGATDDEIQEFLSMNPSTQRPRRVELVQMGRVADSGLTRKTRSGRSATVWVSKEWAR